VTSNAVFRAGVTGLLRFPDFETFAASVPGWDQRHQQIGRGAPGAHFAVAQTARLQLGLVSRAVGVRIEGVPPRDTVTFGIALTGEVRVDGEAEQPCRCPAGPRSIVGGGSTPRR